MGFATSLQKIPGTYISIPNPGLTKIGRDVHARKVHRPVRTAAAATAGAEGAVAICDAALVLDAAACCKRSLVSRGLNSH